MMKKIGCLILFVIFTNGFFAEGEAAHRFISRADWAATRTQAEPFRLHGNNELNQGRQSTAFGAFNEVHRLASQSMDWETLYSLAQLYCRLGYANMSSQTFGQATAAAYDMAVFELRRPGSGGDCAGGRAGLAAAAGWRDNIRNACTGLRTQGTVDFWTTKAQQNLQMLNANYGPNGCPPVGFMLAYNANSPQGYNNQLTQGKPYRPYGRNNGNLVNAWCPFKFDLTPPVQVGQVLEVRFTMAVKPCGDLESTDQFLIYGNSNQVHVIHKYFPDKLPYHN
jgi:hypothetical protein